MGNFDLDQDPCEFNNLYDDPKDVKGVVELRVELRCLQDKVGDEPYSHAC